ncbi:MAG: TIGR02147 family protein [Bdellovibrio sp.]|nr:TIGR02147 family protein [Bdellovibrio sp.]
MDYDFNRSYRDLIKDEFSVRNSKNKFYSLRAFGRDLGVSTSYLSMIFSGKRHPSVPVAVQMSKGLRWDVVQQEYFLCLLELENPKTQVSKELALERIQNLKKHNIKYDNLDLDIFTSMAHWHYPAICTLLTIKDFKGTPELISRRLNLDLNEVQSALERLQRLGFVKYENDIWMASYENVRLHAVPSEAIRAYHKDVLSLAAEAIDEQSFEERDFSNITVTVDPKTMEQAKKKIIQFQTEMTHLLEGQQASELYQLSIQLFKLTQPAGSNA